MELRDWILADHASVRTRFQQGVTQHVPVDRWRERAGGGGSSIAWLLLHLTVHQDVAIQTAVRDRPPVLTEHRASLGLGGHPSAAGLPESEDRSVTEALDLEVLSAYADAVHATTQQWLAGVALTALDTVPDASWRLHHHAGIPESDLGWLHAMWAGKPVSWFVQWEAIGHGHTHVGEAVSVRNRMGLSPF